MKRGDVIEIKVRDFTGRILDKFNFQISDKVLAVRIFEVLKEKYGIALPKQTVEKEKEWLDMDEELI